VPATSLARWALSRSVATAWPNVGPWNFRGALSRGWRATGIAPLTFSTRSQHLLSSLLDHSQADLVFLTHMESRVTYTEDT